MIFASAEIEVGHGLALENYSLSDQLPFVVKAVRFQSDDNDFDKISYIKYLREVINCVNERGIDNKSQTIKSHTNK